MRSLCYGVIRVAGYALLLAAFRPGLVYLHQYSFWQGGAAGWTIDQLLGIQDLLRDVLVERFPALGQAIRYSGRVPFDWHIGGLSLLTLALRKPLSASVAFTLSVLLWPVVSSRVKLTVTPEHVLLHRWWGRISLPRTPQADGKISFRTAELSALRPMLVALATGLPGSGANNQNGQDRVAVAMHGLRNYRIACPLLTRRADQIVAVCHQTLNRSRQVFMSSH